MLVLRSRRLGASSMVLSLLLVVMGVGTAPANAQQASSTASRIAAASVAAGGHHSCAILDNRSVRCWGQNNFGQLGYGNTDNVGDSASPATAGPVDLGAGRTALAISAGEAHTCAILDDRSVRCWGYNFYGQLGYGNTNNIGDDETPASVSPVDLGTGRTALAIAAGVDHTCAILDNHTVLCWGYNASGGLGYGNLDVIGDNETPASAGPVDLGAGRTALAIAAGAQHTCAVLDNHTVRCWGFNSNGELGYGNTDVIGDNEAPGTAGPVDLGPGRKAFSIAVSDYHTCVILDTKAVRCWGYNASGGLGYGNTDNIGDNETPADAGPVNLGTGRTASAITAAGEHTCAILDTKAVRCWGYNFYGQLGYGHTNDIGDNETPATATPVNLGTGRTALALAAGWDHTCAVLDNRQLRCWGYNFYGQLGYGNTDQIGDNETPGTVGPVDLGRRVRTSERPTLALHASPQRDRTRPYTFTVTGKLGGAFIRDSATCTGKVRLVATNPAGRVLKKVTTKVRRDCTLHARVEITQAQLRTTRAAVRITIKASYAGNGSLRATTARARVTAR
jgi:alpha-tubulin suppressor-like RCC1 family protein